MSGESGQESGFVNQNFKKTNKDYRKHFPATIIYNPIYVSTKLNDYLNYNLGSESRLVRWQISPDHEEIKTLNFDAYTYKKECIKRNNTGIYIEANKELNYIYSTSLEKTEIYLKGLDSCISTKDNIYGNEINELARVFNCYFEGMIRAYRDGIVLENLELLNNE